ncbi:hypothetical protein [Bdellovibrio sp. HCB-162]|uniref:hypothetical protein n=1 Tax=Bdellovibrio sp. HCB-162 TaxID=3394234 RepID=UPI0039BCA952
MTQNQNSKTLWFKRKRYGWGWTPNTIQGWVTILVYTILVALYPLLTEADGSFSAPVFLAITIPLTIGLIILCYLKGEKPKWSWGKEE